LNQEKKKSRVQWCRKSTRTSRFKTAVSVPEGEAEPVIGTSEDPEQEKKNKKVSRSPKEGGFAVD